MTITSRRISRRLFAVAAALVAIVAFLGIIAGVKVRAQNASQAPAARETGYAVKKPVMGGACSVCPWGVESDFVKTVMKNSGYDVQVCHNCAGGPQEARLVSNAKMPPALTNPVGPGGIAIPPPPNGPVDFGVTESTYLAWAYQGSHMFKADGPKKDLRLIGVIQHPSYYLVAVKADSGITDLSQIKEKNMPVKIITGVDEAWEDVLEYYGINKEWVESHGGHIGVAIRPDVRKDFDVIISGGTLENVPEWNIWYEASQKYDLKYLQLPQELLDKMAKDWDMQPGTVPLGLLHGMDHPFPTVINAGGDAVYGRTDMPDDFAYALAKAMDEQQDKLQWTIVNLSYNPHTVWKAFDVPLAPGAARYYKERGYMK
jgi:TRAP transporter TAXI family solute receptor